MSDKDADRARRLRAIKWIVGSAAGLSLAILADGLLRFGFFDEQWALKIAVFVAVATVPQWPIEWLASLAESVTPDLDRSHTSPPGFSNLGAFVGVLERPIFLAALVSRFPELIAAWLVFKGIAGFRVGLENAQLKERRLFQLFLLNSAMSLAGALLGWLVWNMLDLPTYTK
jgi:hypothetical protein